MKYILCGILLLTNVLLSQNPQTTVEKLHKISTRIQSNPDEAKAMIRQLMSSKENLADSLQFDIYKSYAIYYNLKGNQDSALYYNTKAIKFAKNNPKRNIQGHINLAESYRKLNDLTKAEETIKKAQQISLANNNILLGRIYSIIGSYKNLRLNTKEGFKYLHKAIETLKIEKDTLMLVYAQATLAGNYMNQRNYTFAIDLYKEALEGYKKLNHWQNYHLTLINYADCLIYTNEPQTAINALTQALPKLEQHGNEAVLVYAYWKLANAESLLKNIQKSQEYYHRAHTLAIKHSSDRATIITSEAINELLKTSDLKKIQKYIQQLESSPLLNIAYIGDKSYFERQKSNYYEQTGQNKKALVALKNFYRIQDSLEAVSGGEELRNLQAQYQNELQREKNIVLAKENTNLQVKNAFEKKIFWLYLSVTLIALLALGIFVALLKYRNRLQSESIQRIDANHQLILKEHQYEIQQKELLEKDLTLKNLALENSNLKIEQFIEDIENKNELIRKMTDDIEMMTHANTDENLLNECKEKLEALVSKAIVSDEKWDSFLRLFNASYPEYITKVTQKLPNLTPAEIRYITLRKLNLSPRETATALGVQIDSLRLYKHRLRKKYDIQSDEQLSEYLD